MLNMDIMQTCLISYEILQLTHTEISFFYNFYKAKSFRFPSYSGSQLETPAILQCQSFET